MDEVAKAKMVLEKMRQTPMLRGGRSDRIRRSLRERISATIRAQGVVGLLAERIARQLVFKFDVAELGDETVWSQLGQLLRQDAEWLKTHIGLVERQIIVALPKLSAKQIANFLGELRAADSIIARTILNASLDAAEPLPAGRRYLAEFHRVTAQLQALDPRVARTVANATFMARTPREKAMEHLKQFASLVIRFQNDVDFARTVAREAFRAPDPMKAAKRLIADYDAIVAVLSSEGVGSHVARSLAGIASLGADPMSTAHRLLQNFNEVSQLVMTTHPSAARSIALSACRATHPLITARVYMKNYDAIVRLIGRTDPRRARYVACQAFRSDRPLLWAKRYLAELQEGRS